MTTTLSIAAQIAQDIRTECLPYWMPPHMETRLEAIIDANLAGERAKLEAMTKGLEAICARVNGEFDHPALVAYGPLLPDMGADVYAKTQSAMVNLQA